MRAPAEISRSAQSRYLDESIKNVRSVGGARLESLFALGITSVRDVLHHFPFRYNDFSRIVNIRDAPLGENVSVYGRVDDVSLKRPRHNLKIIEAVVYDGTSVLYVSWFNKPWLTKTLKRGCWVFVSGKVEHSYGFRRMASPLLAIIEEHHHTDSKSQETLFGPVETLNKKTDADVSQASILPVYHATASLSSNWIARIVKDVLQTMPTPFDPLPVDMRIRLHLMSLQRALCEIHFPRTLEMRNKARRRLAFDEIFYLLLRLKQQRRISQLNAHGYAHTQTGSALSRISTLLPFDLTRDQRAAIDEITTDMARPEPMNRLLLGDVGSGKTIVAAHALAASFDSGYQAVMMAPTEVLVLQYARKIGPLLDELGIPWHTLTSSTSASARARIRADIAQGTPVIVFGTHALLEPDVVFRDLSLVVIDEQHRFGVEQREALRAKSASSDVLMMTATPIPRSLALVIYGDLAPTYLYSRHQSATVSTHVRDHSMKGEAYEAIRTAIDQGHQAYVICPFIASTNDQRNNSTKRSGAQGKTRQQSLDEADEVEEGNTPMIDLFSDYEEPDDTEALSGVLREAEFLQKKVFPDNTVGLMTGRLSADEKRTTMELFNEGKIDVLVSTTVVEVGIDVPNATVMLIEDADRFGLSQLHQLRGRIGRGEYDGELYLMTRTHNDEARARLRLLEKITDGFELAEADLRLRREGDVLGSRQHGAETLKLIKILEDTDLIAHAHEEVDALLDEDLYLTTPHHAHVAHELAQRLKSLQSREAACG